MAVAVRDRWIFTKDELENTPSRRCGVDADREASYRHQAAGLIQEMGQKLQVTQCCINTAIVYMHRFYMHHSFTRFHRSSTASACLFLAAKVEEQPRRLEHVIRAWFSFQHKDKPQLEANTEAFMELTRELVCDENYILQTLGFNITVDHPHSHIVKTCNMVKASKDLAQTSYFLATNRFVAQTSYFLATNSLHLTTMCLQYTSTTVACSCIQLACKWSSFEIPSSSEGRAWYSYVDPTMTAERLEEITKDFLATLERTPSKIRNKLMSLTKGPGGGGDEPLSLPMVKSKLPPSASAASGSQSSAGSQPSTSGPNFSKPVASSGQKQAGPNISGSGSSASKPIPGQPSTAGSIAASSTTTSNSGEPIGAGVEHNRSQNQKVSGVQPHSASNRPVVAGSNVSSNSTVPARLDGSAGLRRNKTDTALTTISHRDYLERKERERQERERQERERIERERIERERQERERQERERQERERIDREKKEQQQRRAVAESAAVSIPAHSLPGGERFRAEQSSASQFKPDNISARSEPMGKVEPASLTRSFVKTEQGNESTVKTEPSVSGEPLRTGSLSKNESNSRVDGLERKPQKPLVNPTPAALSSRDRLNATARLEPCDAATEPDVGTAGGSVPAKSSLGIDFRRDITHRSMEVASVKSYSVENDRSRSEKPAGSSERAQLSVKSGEGQSLAAHSSKNPHLKPSPSKADKSSPHKAGGSAEHRRQHPATNDTSAVTQLALLQAAARSSSQAASSGEKKPSSGSHSRAYAAAMDDRKHRVGSDERRATEERSTELVTEERKSTTDSERSRHSDHQSREESRRSSKHRDHGHSSHDRTSGDTHGSAGGYAGSREDWQSSSAALPPIKLKIKDIVPSSSHTPPVNQRLREESPGTRASGHSRSSGESLKLKVSLKGLDGSSRSESSSRVQDGYEDGHGDSNGNGAAKQSGTEQRLKLVLSKDRLSGNYTSGQLNNSAESSRKHYRHEKHSRASESSGAAERSPDNHKEESEEEEGEITSSDSDSGEELPPESKRPKVEHASDRNHNSGVGNGSSHHRAGGSSRHHRSPESSQRHKHHHHKHHRNHHSSRHAGEPSYQRSS